MHDMGQELRLASLFYTFMIVSALHGDRRVTVWFHRDRNSTSANTPLNELVSDICMLAASKFIILIHSINGCTNGPCSLIGHHCSRRTPVHLRCPEWSCMQKDGVSASPNSCTCDGGFGNRRTSGRAVHACSSCMRAMIFTWHESKLAEKGRVPTGGASGTSNRGHLIHQHDTDSGGQ